VRDGDIIEIDATAGVGTIHLALSDNELTARATAGGSKPAPRLGGLLEKYSAVVGQANRGAVTHCGAVDWPLDPIPDVQC